MTLPIKVLHVADVINRYDFIDNVLCHCDRTRFRMYACTFTDKSNIEAPVYADVAHYIIGATGRGSYHIAVAKLVSIIRRERIDIVHTHHFDPMVVGVTAARLAGRLTVIGRHYSDALHRLPSPWKRRAYLGTEMFFNRLATRIVVPSARVYQLLTRQQGVSPAKVVQVPYGFDLGKYVPSPGARMRLRAGFAPEDETLIGCFGRLQEEKGQTYLLRALPAMLAKHPRVRIVLVGDGPQRRILESIARELALGDRVLFTGWRTDVVDLLSAVDIVVQPSLTETFSQVMVEALALGKPLVMSDVSGVRDVVRHALTGMVVPPASISAIAEAVGMLLDRPDYAHRLGDAGRTDVRQTLDIRRVVRRYEECYDAVRAVGHAA